MKGLQQMWQLLGLASKQFEPNLFVPWPKHKVPTSRRRARHLEKIIFRWKFSLLAELNQPSDWGSQANLKLSRPQWSRLISGWGNFAASIWLSIAQLLLALHLFCCGDQSDVEVYFYILSDEQAYVLEMVSHLKRESEFLHHIKSILFLLSPSLKSVLILFASPMANSWLFRSLAKCKADRSPLSVVATGKCAIV